MKKALKITGIVLGAILVLMIVLPFAFKGKIKQVIVAQGNKMIDARFDFSKLSLSLFRDFPSVSATLSDFYIVGVDRFELDTLACVGKLSLSFNLSSLWSDDGYQVKRIALERAMVNAIVLEDSTANWDIMKPQPEEAQTDQSASSFNIKLKKLTIDGLRLTYDDRAGKVYATVGDLSAALSGDLSAARSVLKLTAQASGIVFKTGGVAYLNGADFYTKMNVDAEIEKGKYTLNDNVFRLNAIEANLDGWLAMLEDDGYDMDLKFSTPKISFKEILSLVPAIYAKDFESVKATGDVALEGWVKGMYIAENLPAFRVDLKVTDGTFRYPSLPAGVEAINIKGWAENPGGKADLTRVVVDPFSFSMAGNPFYVKAVIGTPVSNMSFDLAARGKLDLGKIKEVYPLDSMQLNGLIDADVQVVGTMESIEKQQYDKLRAQGSVTLANMLVKKAGSPDIDIKRSTLTFSPRYLDLSETNLLIGRNDLTMDCRVENYIAYALKDQTLRGKLNLRSKYLNVNDLMGGDESTATDTSAMSVIEVPRNLDLEVSALLDKVIYDKIAIDNLRGQITVRDGAADLRNLSMNTLGGSVKLNGGYSTAKNKEKPEFNAALDMAGLSFAETFKSVVTIQKIVPLFENLNGNFSGSMKLNTLLDETMSPVLRSLNGTGSLSTKDLSLSQVGVIAQILELAKLGGIAEKKVKDLKLDFTITDGRIKTNPFDIRLGDAAINLSGTTGIDQTVDYTGKVQLPPSVSAVTHLQSVNLKIGGSFTAPKVSVDMKDIASQVVQSVVQGAVSEVGKKLGIDLTDAQKQKTALIETATKGGEIIMDQARKQADALTAQAGKDPVSQIAAKKVAATIISKAQLRVDEMIDKAAAKGDSIIAKVQAGN